MTEEEISKGREEFVKWLNLRALQLTPHYRVICDKMPSTPTYPHHGTLEWATQRWDRQHPLKGWGNPDRMVGDNIEVRYLWKNIKC